MKNLLLISFLLIFLVSDAQITEVDTVYNQDSTGKVIALAVTKKSEVLTTFNVPSNFSFSQSEFAILSKEGGVVKQVKKDKDILVELFPPKVVERFAVKEYERRGENVLISDVGEILALNDKLHFFPAIFIALLVFPFFCLLILSISNAYIEGNGIFNRFARLRLLLSFFLFIGF